MIATVIQARMGSTRLGGKVLMNVLGKPLLQLMVERVGHSKLSEEIIIATTTNRLDDEIVKLCSKLKIRCFRGNENDVLEKAKKLRDISEFNLLEKVSIKVQKEFSCKGNKTLAIIDLGIKKSIISWLLNKKINVVLVPYNTKPQEIIDLKPDGILLSNGPGDPQNAKDAAKVVKDLYGRLPIFGICIGHQVIGLGLGGKTYKLKFGHHGSNQPVKDLNENKVYITSQNHNYVVDENSCEGTELKVTMTNLNDKSVEGVSDKKGMLHSVQFHPEASPGPLDTNNIFDKWLKILKENGKN